jgi:hypothetical protein
VTPEQAKTWLESRAANRTLESRRVLGLARDIIADRWRLTHQGIAFNSAGQLVDGQHRLAAIVMAGKPVPMLASWDLPDDAQLVMDDHRPRSGADVLAIASGSSVSTLYVAVLAMMEVQSGNGRLRYTKEELREASELHGPAAAFVLDSIGSHIRGVTVAPVLAAAARAWYTEDRERIRQFLGILCSGIPQHTPDDSAALRLRDWLISNRDNRRKPGRPDLFARAAYALRRFLDRRDAQPLRAATGDPFPLPEKVTRPRSTSGLRKDVAA